MLAHRSQCRESADPRADVAWVIDRMRGYGRTLGCEFAEGFKRIVIETVSDDPA